jgi:hypothetical protein
MPIQVDSYHLTQFVLHAANDNVDDWGAFIKQLGRLYKKRIPENVLHGLMRKNIPELSTLCNEQLEENRAYTRHLMLAQAEHASRVDRWEKRRNEGNRVAFNEVLRKRREVASALAFQSRIALYHPFEPTNV